MTPVQPEELSALLDGELSVDRARDVERQIAVEPELRREYQRLRQDDARWRRAAQTAAFPPALRLPHEGRRPGRFAGTVALVLLLAAVRVEGKVTDVFLLSFGMHAVALVCLVVGVVWLARDGDLDGSIAPTSGDRAPS